MKLLLAYDGRDRSRVALDETVRVALDEGASVTVFAVIPKSARGTKSGGHVGQAPHARDDVAHAKSYLGERGVQAETKVVAGDPADEILSEARTGDYDLIVVGTRELGRVSKVLLGSVSQAVTRQAPCPVLVVAPERIERFEPTAHAVA